MLRELHTEFCRTLPTADSNFVPVDVDIVEAREKTKELNEQFKK